MYDLAETITIFDPVWGDITGHRYTAVLTLAEGVGTFSDLRFLDAEGKPVDRLGPELVLQAADAEVDVVGSSCRRRAQLRPPSLHPLDFRRCLYSRVDVDPSSSILRRLISPALPGPPRPDRCGG